MLPNDTWLCCYACSNVPFRLNRRGLLHDWTFDPVHRCRGGDGLCELSVVLVCAGARRFL